MDENEIKEQSRQALDNARRKHRDALDSHKNARQRGEEFMSKLDAELDEAREQLALCLVRERHPHYRPEDDDGELLRVARLEVRELEDE